MKDYETLADALQAGCDVAADSGVVITIEVHQNSLVDNSWSALLTHDMVDRPNFGINPDLGNIYWCYDEPEESMEDAIVALAPVSKYWHCKNMYRVHHPENHRAVYVRTNPSRARSITDSRFPLWPTQGTPVTWPSRASRPATSSTTMVKASTTPSRSGRISSSRRALGAWELAGGRSAGARLGGFSLRWPLGIVQVVDRHLPGLFRRQKGHHT